MVTKFCLVLFFVLLVSLETNLFTPFLVFGATSDVVINEIAWMGTSASANNEWIELYNQTTSDISLKGWKLETQDGKLKITLSGTIGAKGFFLLERTDDKTLPDTKADQIYAGALSNSGGLLLLKDTSGREIDRVDASQGWPAGDAKTKETMQRSGDSWITAQGTPRSENHSAPLVQPSAPAALPQASSPSETATAGQAFSVKTEPVTTVPENSARWSTIYINEFLPNPKGADEQGEWIELYNDGEKPVSLAGLLLDDDEGGSPPYHIPAGTTIGAKGFLVFPRAQTKIALNTAGDAVRLLTPAGSVLARISYENAKEDEAAAYDIAKNAFFWTKHPTKSAPNMLSAKTLVAKTKQAPQQIGAVTSLDALPSIDVNDLSAKAPTPAAKEPPKNDAATWLLWGLVLLCGVGALLLWRKWSRVDL